MKIRATWLAVGLAGVATIVATAQQPAKSGLDLSNMDKSVRAQDDFFRYANGGWLARTEIPPDKPAYGAGAEVSDRAEADLRAIIEEAAANTKRAVGSVAQQVGDLYKSFQDDARVEQLGATPIQAELQKIEALKTAGEMATEAGKLSAIGQVGPVGGYIEADAKNPAETVAYLVQAGTALPDRDFYLKDDATFAQIRSAYQAYLEKVFTLTGRANAAADAKAVLGLETELARIQWTQVDSRDAVKTYNKFALTDLATSMPGFDWMAWARPQGLDRARNVIVQQPSFFKGFAAMVPTTPLATWKAWLSAQYISSSAAYLSKPFVDAGFEFFGKTLNGQQAQRPRWKRGVSLINGNLGEAVGRLYVERHFPPAAKVRMQNLIGNLLAAYKQSMTDLDWMTPATRTQALEKLSKFTVKVAYPDKWRDYAGLVIKPDDLVGNIERSQKFENDFQIAKLGKPIDRTAWLMTPQTVNAYYNPLANEIVFPAAILQPPFFQFDADDAVNYGGIGAVIGHEIGHGFDDQGRRFDGTGTLRDWWTPGDEQEFSKRARMLVDQFNTIEALPGLHVNGELTLGENIGDLGGLSIAYKAYQISLGGKPSPVIDGFTGEQRLFLGWGQVWRSKMRDEYLRQLVMSNPHAPSQFRAVVAPSNIQGFYDAFGVKPGDKMYREPAARVRIW
jgi:predicted metalloendopeptidase